MRPKRRGTPTTTKCPPVTRPDASSDADEIASELADRDRDEAGDEAAAGTLRQVDAALERIENGTYGICAVTGKPIPEERLEALPWTDVTVEGAEQEGL